MYFVFFLSLLFTFSLTAVSQPVALIIGTRPEAIKMIPVYHALKRTEVPTVLCSTGQHKEMLKEIFTSFHVTPEYDLEIMKPGQDLFYVTQEVLGRLKELFSEIRPSMVVVQGDTTTALAASMAAFYMKIPVAHVEAGLRTGNIYAPFPEEFNRRAIALVSRLHFAPTYDALQVLVKEGVHPNSIFQTGNTVVDALYNVRREIKRGSITPSQEIRELVHRLQDSKKKIILLTAHRRESVQGTGLREIYSAITKALQDMPEIAVVYPMHPNPAIKKTAEESNLHTIPHLHIIPPLSYADLVYALDASCGVATDSGGIQEEAVSFNKPVLILRNETDRPEGLVQDFVELVGTDYDKIYRGLCRIAQSSLSQNEYSSVYGDGQASTRIAQIISEFLRKNEQP